MYLNETLTIDIKCHKIDIRFEKQTKTIKQTCNKQHLTPHTHTHAMMQMLAIFLDATTAAVNKVNVATS